MSLVIFVPIIEADMEGFSSWDGDTELKYFSEGTAGSC